MIILIIIASLITASFLTQCIYRIPGSKPVFGPPHCMSCGTTLRPLELIPVLSYILSRGRCRHCNTQLPVEYPLVELITVFVFVILYSRYGFTVDFIAGAFLMSILIAVFFIDLHHKIIPNGLVLAGLAGGIPLMIYNIFGEVAIYGDRAWWNPFAGGVGGSGLLLAVAIMGAVLYKTDGALGMGDVKIFLPIGIFLGWRMTIIALVLAIFTGGITSAFLLATKLKDRKSAIPFGPFIVAGTFIAFIWGWEIYNWYMPNILN